MKIKKIQLYVEKIFKNINSKYYVKKLNIKNIEIKNINIFLNILPFVCLYFVYFINIFYSSKKFLLFLVNIFIHY